MHAGCQRRLVRTAGVEPVERAGTFPGATLAARVPARLFVPSILAVSTTLLGLLVRFRAALAEPVATAPAVTSGSIAEPRAAAGLIGLAVVAVCYVLCVALEWPLGLAALGGAIVLLAAGAISGGWHPRAVPWALLPLFGGLVLLVEGATRAGLVAPVAAMLDSSAGLGAVGPRVVVFGIALLANLVNKLPASLVAASALGNLPAGVERSSLAASGIVGVNLGPNLTTVGLLATILWLVLLGRRGVDVSALAYLRVGALVTLPALGVPAAALWMIAGVISSR